MSNRRLPICHGFCVQLRAGREVGRAPGAEAARGRMRPDRPLGRGLLPGGRDPQLLCDQAGGDSNCRSHQVLAGDRIVVLSRPRSPVHVMHLLQIRPEPLLERTFGLRSRARSTAEAILIPTTVGYLGASSGTAGLTSGAALRVRRSSAERVTQKCSGCESGKAKCV